MIDVADTDISDDRMDIMLNDIEDKKRYKHELLDYFVYLLDDNLNSQQLHQEIARYLGMDKYHLNRVYKTVDGNHVRSKSEVIICDLLAKSGIKYKYEEPLYYQPGKHIMPDFTIYLKNGDIRFWEHVGMLGNEKYTSNWANKVDIYDTYYPGKLYKTYESGAISVDADAIIKEIEKIDQ